MTRRVWLNKEAKLFVQFLRAARNPRGLSASRLESASRAACRRFNFSRVYLISTRRRLQPSSRLENVRSYVSRLRILIYVYELYGPGLALRVCPVYHYALRNILYLATFNARFILEHIRNVCGFSIFIFIMSRHIISRFSPLRINRFEIPSLTSGSLSLSLSFRVYVSQIAIILRIAL